MSSEPSRPASPQEPLYRERLWPGAGALLASALLIPAALLVFLPISMPVGISLAIGLYLLALGFLLGTSPTIEVTAHQLRAGPARLPLSFVGDVQAFDGDEAAAERGTRLDARAWLLLRGWAKGVVKVALNDQDDPTPYWLVSTRRPAELAAAIEQARG